MENMELHVCARETEADEDMVCSIRSIYTQLHEQNANPRSDQ